LVQDLKQGSQGLCAWIGSLQILELALSLVELLPDNQTLGQAQPCFEDLLPLLRLTPSLQLCQQVGGLRVGRIELQGSLVLLFSHVGKPLAERTLAGGNQLANLPQSIAFLDGTHFQAPYAFVIGDQRLRLSENADGFPELALIEGLLAVRYQQVQLQLLIKGRKLLVDFRGTRKLLLQTKESILCFLELLLCH
jgi:hypothetical protein